MPFDRPGLTELRVQAATDFQAALPGVDALLRYSNLGVTGEVLAGLAHGHYGYLDWIAKQSVPFTATDEYLEGWAALKGIIRKPATRAIGSATFPATNGKVVPAGTPVTRSDGVNYTSSAEATAALGVVAVPMIADPPGAAANASDGSAMFLGAGISGVTGIGAATGPVTGGADVETDADLRNRMLAAYAASPQGGSVDDYGQWSLAVPGVTRCWVVPSGMGPGSVVLLFMMDLAEAAHGGFPQGSDGCATLETRGATATGDQLALANALFSQQPVTALVYAVAPIANTIGVTIAGIAGASTATKAAIAAAFAAALLAEGRPGGVTDSSIIERAIASVAGTDGFVLTAITATHGMITPSPTGNIASDAGALPVPGAITYT